MPHLRPGLVKNASRAESREFIQERSIRPHFTLVAHDTSHDRVSENSRQRTGPLPSAQLEPVQYIVDKFAI